MIVSYEVISALLGGSVQTSVASPQPLPHEPEGVMVLRDPWKGGRPSPPGRVDLPTTSVA
eukprot:231557-Pyramimonas_sp.AAC.1